MQAARRVPAAGVKAYTTHYYGNAGPKPSNGQPYHINTVSQAQGGLAADGVLPFIPFVVTALSPTPGPAAVQLPNIIDGTSNTLMVFEASWTAQLGLLVDDLDEELVESWLRTLADRQATRQLRTALRSYSARHEDQLGLTPSPRLLALG